MKVKMTKAGKTITIEKIREKYAICAHSDVPKCSIVENPEFIEFLISYAFHKGWKVERTD